MRLLTTRSIDEWVSSVEAVIVSSKAWETGRLVLFLGIVVLRLGNKGEEGSLKKCCGGEMCECVYEGTGEEKCVWCEVRINLEEAKGVLDGLLIVTAARLAVQRRWKG